jgi:dTDP-4-amino-4,6-dideoxygalactose transaminase
MIREFECEFAAFSGASDCIAVGSYVDALLLALLGAGVKRGDVVVTVPNGPARAVEAILCAKAQPEFVDINERTYNMDPDSLRRYLEFECYVDDRSREVISRRSRKPVRAVLPAHLYGQMAEMDPIQGLTERYNLLLIENAVQAHGAQYLSERNDRWQKPGAAGVAAAFSFYPGMNLYAAGEGGAIVTSNGAVTRRVRKFMNLDKVLKQGAHVESCASRLGPEASVILRMKLRDATRWIERRRESAHAYREFFAGGGDAIILPIEPAWAKSVYEAFVVRVKCRADLIRHLSAANIIVGIHSPVPMHMQSAHKRLGYQKGTLPVAEKVAPEMLSLPLCPETTIYEQSKLANEILTFLRTKTRAMSASMSSTSPQSHAVI